MAMMNVGCAGDASAHAQSAASLDTHAEAAKIRALDADRVKAAATRSADARVAFCSPDAVVLPPNEKIAKTPEAIHASVAGLLGLPVVSIMWIPAKVEVAASGELAHLYAAYTFSAKDPSGKPSADTDKNVEIWKRQADGPWKCAVDTWNGLLPAAP